MPKVIALNGPVGVGKTTLLNEFKTYLHNCYIVPEYIDVLNDAETNLSNYLNGLMPAFDFQNYILDYFETVANQLKNSSYDYIFVERTPVEGILYFAKLDLINHGGDKSEQEGATLKLLTPVSRPEHRQDWNLLLSPAFRKPCVVNVLQLLYCKLCGVGLLVPS